MAVAGDCFIKACPIKLFPPPTLMNFKFDFDLIFLAELELLNPE